MLKRLQRGDDEFVIILDVDAALCDEDDGFARLQQGSPRIFPLNALGRDGGSHEAYLRRQILPTELEGRGVEFDE